MKSSRAIAIIIAFVSIVPAFASIDYTPVNRIVPNNGASGIDFDHDGVKDFWIGSFFHATLCGNRGREWGSVNLSPVENTSGVILTGMFAAALPAGVPVGPDQTFIERKTDLISFSTGCGTYEFAGNWFNTSNHYLGLEFQIGGQTHFGWAELSVNAGKFAYIPGFTTVLVGYAYETVPGKSIITGQTGVPNACAPPSTDQTIHICTPVAGSTVAGEVAISAQTRWDTHTIYHMRVYIDDVDLYDERLPPGGAIETTLSLSSGKHHLVITAWDTHGNRILSGETFTTQ